jgi:hypothetical protein
MKMPREFASVATCATGCDGKAEQALYGALGPRSNQVKFRSHKTMREVLTESPFTNIQFSGAGRIPWLWNRMDACRERVTILQIAVATILPAINRLLVSRSA